MPEADIQLVTNEAGQTTAVLIPIELWKEIASERETAYLLKSETMRQRLLGGLEREGGVPLDDALSEMGLVRSIEFDSDASEDFAWWAERDRLKRFASFDFSETPNAIRSLGSVSQNPCGMSWRAAGKRRIDQEHRVVYQVLPEKIRVLACRYHY